VDARAIAQEAFIFGFPLVLMDVSRSSMQAPPNELSHLRAFPDASFTAVVSPNADTLYSTAFIDVEHEPVVLHVPDSAGRYYLMPLLSAWTDVFASPGTRTTGNGAGAFAIVGPGWKGELPAGVQAIQSPTSVAWMIGRTQTNGKPDCADVHRFQDGLSLVPLSAWGGEYRPPAAAPGDQGADTATPPPAQVAAMDAATFFGRLASLMVANPPYEADAPALKRFEAIGLAPGSFDASRAPAAVLDEGMRAALSKLEEIGGGSGKPAAGWEAHRGLGAYGTDYVKRAFVALVGLGANLDADSIYPHARTDGAGQPLDGANSYALHFDAGQTPPARAFWSLTMYDEDQYFVDNPLDRYAIGDRDALAFNPDGSLDIWLQHESPGPERESNWLPAPAGPFNVIMRIYWPTDEALESGWVPPPIERLA
jgi:hypothetical protein